VCSFGSDRDGQLGHEPPPPVIGFAEPEPGSDEGEDEEEVAAAEAAAAAAAAARPSMQPYLGPASQAAQPAAPTSALEQWRQAQRAQQRQSAVGGSGGGGVGTSDFGAAAEVTPPAITSSVAAQHPEFAFPQLWRKWVASLRQRGFFDGAAEGSKEYRARMAKARTKFAQSKIVLERMGQQQQTD